MFYKFFLLLFITNILFSQDKISLQWLSDKPKTIAKDFYINQYLKQDITPQQSLEALAQVNLFNNQIFSNFVNKYNNADLKDYIKCTKLPNKKLLSQKPYCIEAGLSIYDATKLSNKELNKLIEKLKSDYLPLTKILSVMASDNSFKQLVTLEPNEFFKIFNNCGSYYRAKKFDQVFDETLIKKLQKYKDFETTLKLIITNPSMKKAQQSLANIQNHNFSNKTLLLLGINALKQNNTTQAIKYMNLSHQKAYYQFEKDNTNFWLFTITKDKKYLEKLLSSWDLNLYTLFAHNHIGKKYEKNLVFDLNTTTTNLNNFNISDPFSWIPLLNKTRKITVDEKNDYISLFNSPDTTGHQAFILERFHRYRNSYFVKPYYSQIKNYEKDRQALIYAIGRQESRFIPSSISTAYAMGVMQIMPFLSKALAKQLKEPYNIYDQLNPYVNIKYANKHLNFLDRSMKHPLFIAYAYNGGIGFTKRTLKKGLFNKKNPYEPYLSMELIPYDETKKYGKKVLANYFIYQNHLNSDNQISFNELINSISFPIK